MPLRDPEHSTLQGSSVIQAGPRSGPRSQVPALALLWSQEEPGRVAELEKQAGQFVLPARRERSYPRCVKPRPQKYSVKKANKNNASQA